MKLQDKTEEDNAHDENEEMKSEDSETVTEEAL